MKFRKDRIPIPKYINPDDNTYNINKIVETFPTSAYKTFLHIEAAHNPSVIEFALDCIAVLVETSCSESQKISIIKWMTIKIMRAIKEETLSLSRAHVPTTAVMILNGIMNLYLVHSCCKVLEFKNYVEMQQLIISNFLQSESYPKYYTNWSSYWLDKGFNHGYFNGIESMLTLQKLKNSSNYGENQHLIHEIVLVKTLHSDYHQFKIDALAWFLSL